MSSGWKNLMILALLFFFAVIGWEIYQLIDGAREDFGIVVVDMPRNQLFEKPLTDFLTN